MGVRRSGRLLPQRCVGCGQLTEKWVLHHIVPVENGGQDIPSNLAILCRPCHYAAHKLADLDDDQRWQEFKRETNEKMVVKLMETKSADDIVKGLAQFYGVSVDAIRGKRRKKRLVQVRAHIAHALRNESDLSLKEIGRFLGNRDHSTIFYYLHTRNPDGSKKA